MLFKEEQLKEIPTLYSQDGLGDKARVCLSIHLGGFIWLITEYDGNDIFFGWVCLDDEYNAELGYISKNELEELSNQFPLDVNIVDTSLGELKKKYFDGL